MNPVKKIALSLSLLVSLSVGLIIWNPQRTESESTSQFFWTNKTHSSVKHDIVVYGDSRVYRGFSTEAFLGDSKLTCFNYGYSSGSMSKRMLDFAASKIDKTNTPILILGVTVHSFTESAIKDKQFLQELNRPRLEVFQRMYKARYLRAFDPISPKDIFGFSKNIEHFHQDGWISKSEIEYDTLSGIESYKKTLSNTQISKEAMTDFFTFVDSLTHTGVQVYAYRPPTMVSMDQLEEDLTIFNPAEFESKFQEAGGIWINVNREGYQTFDGSHLDLKSTIELSEYIGSQVIK